MRDLHSNIKTLVALNPGTIAANVATNGAIIDMKGYRSLEIAILAGTITDGTYTASLQHGDQANLSDAVTVPAGDLLGAAPVILATEDNTVEKFGYRGTKRYVRLVLTSTGVTTGGALAAVALQADANSYPL
jgi:uncharacterized PurR-regulated membrane protein YhhQ (DUF165 family)